MMKKTLKSLARELSSEELASMIDHTFLSPDGEKGAVRKLCREAKNYNFASVCVNPSEVKLAAQLLKGSSVAVCTVVGFPLGQNATRIKVAEAIAAIEDGASELDFVINQRLLKYDPFGPAGCKAELVELVAASKRAGGEGIVTKLILECCNLTDEEISLACTLAKDAGFDFVKTSTGFGSGGAREEDVRLMRRCVGKKMGVKASGGIRTREDACKMIAAGASRIGCSSSIKIVKGEK